MTHRFYRTLILTGTDAKRLRQSVDSLRALLRGDSTRVIGVNDPRKGNLFGTLHAWKTAQSLGALTPPIAILHDAGEASRCFPLTESCSRGVLYVCTDPVGQPIDLNQLIIQSLRHFCPASPTEVHVFWGSQLLLPSGPIPPLRRPIAKFATRSLDPFPPNALDDLGLIGHSDDTLVYLQRGHFKSEERALRWARSQHTHGWDLGSFAISSNLLNTLARQHGDADPASNVDRDLFLPMARTGQAHVLPITVEWHRVRRPTELLALSLAALSSARLRALMGVTHPISHSHLGDLYIEGPEISWEAVAEGVTIGGVWVQNAIIRGAALRSGSHVRGSVIERSLGQLTASGSRVFHSTFNSTSVRDSLVYHASLPDGFEANGLLVWSEDGTLCQPLLGGAVKQAIAESAPLNVQPNWLLSHNTLIEEQASSCFFASIISQADTLNPARRQRLIHSLCDTWVHLATLSLPLKNPLSALELSSAKTLLDRRSRQRTPKEIPPHPTTIALLSRVTIGADLCITLPLIAALRAQFPAAQIVLIGASRALHLPVDQQIDLPFARGGTVRDRLVSALHLKRALDALGPDLIINPDSRLDQLGTLPIYPADRGLYLDTCGDERSMSVHVLSELARLTGGPLFAMRSGLLASSVHTPKVPKRPMIAFKWDVGGDERKRLSLPFERALMQATLDAGFSLLIDTGWGAIERAQSDERLHSFKPTPITSAHLPESPHVFTYSGDLNGWASYLAQCALAAQYDSVNGHLALALNVPSITFFSRAVPASFLAAWTPFEQSALLFKQSPLSFKALITDFLQTLSRRLAMPVHPAARSFFQRSGSFGTPWRTLALWLESGRYGFALTGPPLPKKMGHAIPLEPGEYRAISGNPDAQIRQIADHFAAHFIPCTSNERAALVQRLIHDTPSLGEPSMAKTLAAIDRFSLANDPDRRQLVAHYERLFTQLKLRPPPLENTAQSRAWLRYLTDYALSRSGLGGEQAVQFLRQRAPSLFCSALLSLNPVAFSRSPLQRSDWADWLCAHIQDRRRADHTLVIGILGPCAVGKSTLVQRCLAQLQRDGITALHLSADAYLWRGSGFRYQQQTNDRVEHLTGPCIYNHQQLTADIQRAQRGERLQIPDDPHGAPGRVLTERPDVILTDGVTIGLHPPLYHQLDLLIGLFDGDVRRLAQKRARDTGPGHTRRVHLEWDFAQKQLSEYKDVILPLFQQRADCVLDGDTGRLWKRLEPTHDN